MIRLGLRLALAGGRAGRAATVLSALAVALGTAILLFALSFAPALQLRYDHAAWRDTRGVDGDPSAATEGLAMLRTGDHWRGLTVTRMEVAALSADAPVPPGLPRLPAAGEAFVSPALARLIAASPADELGDRFGRVAGTISDAGLMAPDELAAVVGMAPGELVSLGNRPDGARVATALDGTGEVPMPSSPFVQALVLIAIVGALAPVAVFTAMASRLSAARRGRRLAALRLVGATPRQVQALAAVESLVATVPGTAAGVALFLALRPLVAQIPLMGGGWFPESIAPPPGPAAALLLAVPAAGAVAAVSAIRGLIVSPLGVQRRARPAPLRRRRLLPLAASLVAFALAVALLAHGVRGSVVPAMVGAPFLGVVLGIAYAGPWLTAAVGAAVARAARGPVALLAGRRLLDEPAGSFGAVAGVVLAVFVGSAFFGLASFARAAVPAAEQLALRPGALVSRYGDEAAAEATAAALRSTPGVSSVAVLREVVVVTAQTADGSQPDFAVVVDCASLVSVLDAPGLSCAGGLEHLGPGGRGITAGSAQAFGFLSEPAVLPTGSSFAVALSVPADRVDRYAPDAPPDPAASVPAVLIEPAALGPGLAALVPTRIVVATDGSPAAVERARTVIERSMPTAIVATRAERSADASAPMDELARVVSLGVLGALLLAGASLSIAVATGLVERRVPFALLRLAGMPLGRLRLVLLLEASAPLVAVSAVSAVLGTLVVQVLLRAQSGIPVPPPDLGGLVLLAVAVSASLGIVAAALPLVGPVTSTSETRFE
ncbi:MAG: FtsX-like permease family protein [Candidatus Limnocylindrales bacterium]